MSHRPQWLMAPVRMYQRPIDKWERRALFFFKSLKTGSQSLSLLRASIFLPCLFTHSVKRLSPKPLHFKKKKKKKKEKVSQNEKRKMVAHALR
jgi:hypothetical protein